ncbi:DUF4345 domain-containing protein [bacterium SCSIO 12741]|nr:DUF4345 domain-containing protein [bacterium SCSIO 12741]
MKTSVIVKVFLILTAIVGLYVGINLVFFPIALQAQNNIILEGNISLLSETRAPGTAILSASILILIGAFRASWHYLALLITALFFMSYGLGRVFSYFVDGRPADGLFYAMFLELVFGIGALILMRRVSSQLPA